MSHIDILVGDLVSGLGILRARPPIGLCVLSAVNHIGKARNAPTLIVMMVGYRE